jgi:hypothetical protein
VFSGLPPAVLAAHLNAAEVSAVTIPVAGRQIHML